MKNAKWVIVSDSGRDITGWENGKILRQPARKASALDRVGAGDALTAGVLDGLLDGDFASGLARGAVMAAAAMGQAGDMASVSRAELNAALQSENQSGVAR